jgi:DNA polymerase III delta subunit
MIVIAIGPDASMVRHAVAKHARQADPDGQSTSEMDGNTVSMQDIIQAIGSVGFFSAGRVVIVHNFIAKMNKTGGRGKNAPDWSALFGAVPAASTLILADPGLVSIPAGVRKALPADAATFEGDPPRGPALVGWIRKGAESLGSRIDETAARYLAERLYPQSWQRKSNNPAFDRPPDLDAIRNEVGKLATAADPEPITRELIDELVARGDDDRIFGFIDAVVRGDIAGATTELDRLIVAGEDPHRILAQLGQTIELTAMLATAERQEPVAVGREIGLSNPNRMTAIARGLRSSSPRRAQRALRVMTTADRMMKTGELRDGMDVLYYVIAGMAPHTESG